MRHPYYGELVTRDGANATWLVRRRIRLDALEARLRSGESDGEILRDPLFADLRPRDLAIIRYRVESSDRRPGVPAPSREDRAAAASLDA